MANSSERMNLALDGLYENVNRLVKPRKRIRRLHRYVEGERVDADVIVAEIARASGALNAVRTR